MQKASAFLIVAVLAMSLSACGGGGSPEPTNTATISQAIDNIADKTPQPSVFTGAFVTLNGQSAGYVSGKDNYDVVAAAVTPIVDNPNSFPELYKLLLSDAGLRVVVLGKVTGTSPLGLVQHEPDSVFVVTLRSDGLHVVQGS